MKTEKALSDIVDADWELGAQATAVAKTGDKGAIRLQGAVAVRREDGSTRSRETALRSSRPPKERSTIRTAA